MVVNGLELVVDVGHFGIGLGVPGWVGFVGFGGFFGGCFVGIGWVFYVVGLLGGCFFYVAMAADGGVLLGGGFFCGVGVLNKQVFCMKCRFSVLGLKSL